MSPLKDAALNAADDYARDANALKAAADVIQRRAGKSSDGLWVRVFCKVLRDKADDYEARAETIRARFFGGGK